MGDCHMDEMLAVPDELHEARNEVIRYAKNGGDRPNGLEAIKKWFSDDQAVWGNLHSEAAAMNFDPAVSTKHGYLYRACDSELRERQGLDDDQPINDAMRISFVRELLEEDWDLENPLIVGIGQRWLRNEKGDQCLIGYTEELEGQSGIVCYWQGVFADEEKWHRYLENEGYIRAYEPSELPDEALLSLHQFNI